MSFLVTRFARYLGASWKHESWLNLSSKIVILTDPTLVIYEQTLIIIVSGLLQ